MDHRPNTHFTIDRQQDILSLIIICAAMLACTFLVFGLNEIIAGWWGFESSSSAIEALNENSTSSDRDFVRWSAIVNQLGTFLIPSLIFTILFYKNNWSKYLQITNFPKISNLLLGAMLMIAVLPLVQFSSWINMKVPLPQWAIEMEEMMASLIDNILRVDQPYELWANLFVIAVIPAFCEELLFRGVVQKKLYNWVKSPHVAVWIAAVVFSTIHFQFQGFLPRVLLGAALGYLYLWTGNLWTAIFGHFLNNALTVVSQYLNQTGQIDIDLDNIEDVNWLATLISLAAVIFLGKLFLKNNNISTIKDEQDDIANHLV